MGKVEQLGYSGVKPIEQSYAQYLAERPFVVSIFAKAQSGEYVDTGDLAFARESNARECALRQMVAGRFAVLFDASVGPWQCLHQYDGTEDANACI